MKRILMTAAFAMFAFAGVAHAEEVKIGAGTVQAPNDGYIDTYPGMVCGVKAVRVAVLNYNDNASVQIGRVYFSTDAQANPWNFGGYAKVNQKLAQGQSTGWISLGKETCLRRVRVYVDSRQTFPDHTNPSFRVVVYGLK